ncbi:MULTISPECIES: TrkA family potassium uptake protein [unclassified Paenibacillus]|uniref:potassium channel family protein n=1 Tax=unclassified Paenibacillus TaxID=185978 RepID=UPI00277E6330|nr:MULTISPECIES: TrkA family potassium uptake protein [unclassified Paenibacillus]MDQ0901801.1 trk system potassium uptake protein TrkA [Paenibacillus sp. V4I7]MDQ0919698.1 trk system potassium uptake protein TrkA [Paenibacillus sp. V4I5]
MRKQFAIIGMGRFGSSVAKTLSQLGFEVLAIDHREETVQEVSAFVTHAVQADSTDEEALRALGIRNFDVVVVAIGEDIQASILTTLILKEMGIPTTVVKAVNDLHGKVLKKIGADKVVYPERDMGQRVAHHLISSNIIDYIELSADYSIVEIKVSPQIIGKSLRQLDIRAKYGCNVIAIKQNEQLVIPPSGEEPLKQDDILVIVGKNSNLQTFEVTFAE